MSQPQVMLASYQVEVDQRQAFLDELIATEAAYREGKFVTERPIMRMVSKKDPELILEVIEFASAEAVSAVMTHERVQAHWGRLKSLWKDGDFAADRIPEAHEPWPLLDSL